MQDLPKSENTDSKVNNKSPNYSYVVLTIIAVVVFVVVNIGIAFWYFIQDYKIDKDNTSTPSNESSEIAENPETILRLSLDDYGDAYKRTHYTLTPDESQILYVTDTRLKKSDNGCTLPSEKFEFFIFPLNTRKPTKIHEIVFNREYFACNLPPYVYWADDTTAIVGGNHSPSGLCQAGNTTNAAMFSLDT